MIWQWTNVMVWEEGYQGEWEGTFFLSPSCLSLQCDQKKLENTETMCWVLVMVPLSVHPFPPIPSALCRSSQGTIHSYRALPRL